jgi:hypothetical protein
MRAEWVRWAAVLLGVWVGGLSCGPILEDPLDGDPLDGPTCFSDSDCVPNGCCGQGTGAVHESEAPDCRAVRCSGTCNPSMVQCGCGIPLCRNSRCAVAYTSGSGCP